MQFCICDRECDFICEAVLHKYVLSPKPCFVWQVWKCTLVFTVLSAELRTVSKYVCSHPAHQQHVYTSSPLSKALVVPWGLPGSGQQWCQPAGRWPLLSPRPLHPMKWSSESHDQSQPLWTEINITNTLSTSITEQYYWTTDQSVIQSIYVFINHSIYPDLKTRTARRTAEQPRFILDKSWHLDCLVCNFCLHTITCLKDTVGYKRGFIVLKWTRQVKDTHFDPKCFFFLSQQR